MRRQCQSIAGQGLLWNGTPSHRTGRCGDGYSSTVPGARGCGSGGGSAAVNGFAPQAPDFRARCGRILPGARLRAPASRRRGSVTVVDPSVAEVRAVADGVVVLHNGRLVSDLTPAAATEQRIVRDMVGTDLLTAREIAVLRRIQASPPPAHRPQRVDQDRTARPRSLPDSGAVGGRGQALRGTGRSRGRPTATTRLGENVWVEEG